MVTIRVLLENTTSSPGLKSRHGLSIAIEREGGDLLLDVGPDGLFAENARKMGFDLAGVAALALSHSHFDHTGGLDEFCRLNSRAAVYLLDTTDSEYYAKLFGLLRLSVGLRCSEAARRRITSLRAGREIAKGAWFIPNSVGSHPKPRQNRVLFKKVGGRLLADDFAHEGLLVVEEGGELVVFNSCSHNGVVNSLESVAKAFPGKRVRSYVGGFHFHNPLGLQNESAGDLDAFADYVRKSGVRLYTGHCTGARSVACLKQALGDQLHTLSTGLVLEV